MTTLSAFVTDQLSVLDSPAVIVLGLASNDAITGGESGRGLTTIVTRLVVVPPRPVAVSVYVVVVGGFTTVDPDVATPPTLGSMTTFSAFVTDQLSVLDSPAGIVLGFASNDAITGGSTRGLTTIVTCFVAVPPQPIALSV